MLVILASTKRYNKLLKSDSQRVAFFTMRRFMCLRYYAEAKVLRCSHLSKALRVKESLVES